MDLELEMGPEPKPAPAPAPDSGPESARCLRGSSSSSSSFLLHPFCLSQKIYNHMKGVVALNNSIIIIIEFWEAAD